MIPLRKLRRMRATLERFMAVTSPLATGSWDDGAGGWCDIDEANRSLTEAWMYVDLWIKYRQNHKRDPVPGGVLSLGSHGASRDG